MKRLRRWLLIAAVLVGLMAHVGAIRATALLYGKSSTTTTTTTTEAAVEEETTEVQPSENNTSTKQTLTGIPQIDYIWDPNLPRELNGYNLSDYPFYSSVPPKEEIDFKCDGLHDGFYASIKHKCQLYHHCLYGVRYDFLCANFTAFDQKTFICHFASEVDCKNSPKYFHRNDALYEPTTTTTTTTTPAPSTAAPVTAEPVPAGPGRQRPGRPLRRPLRRRRPQADYYYYDEDYDDDYYEERANRRRKQRPRTRRPDYDEEYDGRSYSDDERYNKRPYNREGGRDSARDSEEYDYERRTSDRPRNRNRPGDKRRLGGDEDRVERRKNGERKRPIDERRPSSDERRPQGGERRFKPDDRRSFLDDRRSSPDRPRIPPTKDDSDVDDTEEVRRPPISGRRRFKDRRPIYDESPETVEDLEPEKRDEDVAPVVRPTGPGVASGSLFDRPRVPPKVSRPVPFNERKKFEYPTKKPTTTTATSVRSDDYYEDYDDLPAKSHEKEVGDEKGRPGSSSYESPARDTPAREPASRDKPSRGASPGREFTRKPSISSARDDQKQRFDALDSPNPLTDEEYDDRSDGKYRPYDRETARNNPKREEQRDDFEVRTLKNSQPDLPRQPYKEVTRSGDARPLVTNVNEEVNKNTKNTEENVREVRPIVRVVKRPFLPSRGGNPYLPRGLQPVGSSAQKSEKAEILSSRLAEPSVGSSRRPVSYNEYQPQQTGSRTTQAPQVEPPKSALDDIYDNEYDVTLNDALNPTLKPLVPNRGLPSGFSLGNKFDRNRYTSPSSSFGYNSNDSAYSSTHIRRTSIESPSSRSSSRLSSNSNSKNGQSKVAQTYYDEEEYDY